MTRSLCPILDDYDRDDDFRRSIEFAYAEIRRRVAAGGRGWRGYPEVKKCSQRAPLADGEAS